MCCRCRRRLAAPSHLPTSQAAGPRLQVLSDALWRQRFGADLDVVGRLLILDGKPRAIVGVLAADFRVPTPRLSAADVFVPIHMDVERVGWEGDHNNDAFGRLGPGVTPEQARAELDVLQRQVSVMATKEAGEPRDARQLGDAARRRDRRRRAKRAAVAWLSRGSRSGCS